MSVEPSRAGRGGSDAAPSSFARYAAIDWSGAKGRRHKGIAVAICEAGHGAPRLVRPGHVWSRTEALDWITATAAEAPTLIAMDFSFAPPLHERGSYLPGSDAPVNARAFWKYVDSRSDDEDFGAASFLETAFPEHFYFGAASGTKAGYMHLRACEKAFNAGGGGKPSSIYDVIGAAQVAKASFAGMRLLHQLNGHVPIWPFDFTGAPDAARLSGQSLVAELYTRIFIRMGGSPRGLKLRDTENLNAALMALGSKPVVKASYNDHQTDVLVSAAGLRRIAGNAAYWSPKGLTPEIAHTEGWTFGVA